MSLDDVARGHGWFALKLRAAKKVKEPFYLRFYVDIQYWCKKKKKKGFLLTLVINFFFKSGISERYD